jgi:RNA recognition motif-containing protein
MKNNQTRKGYTDRGPNKQRFNHQNHAHSSNGNFDGSRNSSFTFGKKHIPNTYKNQLPVTQTQVGQGITVSNLARSVTDADIIGLFSEFGVVKSSVHYSREGDHLETASATFPTEADARRAVAKYNNVSLDKRPMRIKLNQPEGLPRSLEMRLSTPGTCEGQSIESSLNVSGSSVNDRSSYKKHHGQNEKRKRKKAPDSPSLDINKLNKELDDYMGTTNWINQKAHKKKSESSTSKLKTQSKMSKRQRISILEPDESSPESKMSKRRRISILEPEEEVDMDLDGMIDEVYTMPTGPVNEVAERVQTKLFNLL